MFTNNATALYQTPDPQRFKTPSPLDLADRPTELGIWHIDRLKYVKLIVHEGKIYVDIRNYVEDKFEKLTPTKRGKYLLYIYLRLNYSVALQYSELMSFADS